MNLKIIKALRDEVSTRLDERDFPWSNISKEAIIGAFDRATIKVLLDLVEDENGLQYPPGVR